jgi:SsrA-binding protein
MVKNKTMDVKRPPKAATAEKKRKPREKKSVALNRKARFEYSLGEVMEAGLVLQGTEVKSLRLGRANIADSYASAKGGEIWLWNTDIPVYAHGNRNNHEPKRGRKLLLSARQIKKLIGELKVRGTTLIPLELYFNARGYAKVALAVAKGKTQYEKRDVIKQRDWKRQQEKLLKS